jgi:hypothetical protein
MFMRVAASLKVQAFKERTENKLRKKNTILNTLSIF